jgi:8-oxo-dGTP pyrophosphatase MutT (NUDIX family)
VVLNQPAGHLDEGETLIDAVIRETIEETAWHIEPTALLGVYRWLHPTNSTTYLRFAFIAHALREEQGRTLDHGCLRALWLTPEEIRANRARLRSTQVERCLDDYLAGTRFPLDLLKEHAPGPAR